jgi:two-component system, OmpR family, response regulator VanR
MCSATSNVPPSAWSVGSGASDARQPHLAEAIRDGLRLAAIAADIAGDGDTALELLSINIYDIAVLDRDIPGLSGDEIRQTRLVTVRRLRPCG